MAGQVGFFDLEDRLASLSAAGDPLERLSSTVDFEIFRPALKRALRRSARSKGGRPPCDAVVMFRILVLQALHGLSDGQAEHQVRDRLSFMRLLELGLGERIPDERTIRLSCERLVRAGAIDKLFDRFGVELENRGHLAMSGRTREVTRPVRGIDRLLIVSCLSASCALHREVHREPHPEDRVSGGLSFPTAFPVALAALSNTARAVRRPRPSRETGPASRCTRLR